VYPVSNDFKVKMKDPQRVEHIRGTVDNIPFTDANIISLRYSNRCSDTKDVTLGSAYIGQIEVSFCNLNIIRGSWRGLTINIEYGLEIDDLGTTEWLPIGSFFVTQAEWTDTGINITASDCLARLDNPIQFTSTVGKIYGFLYLLAIQSGVQLGITQVESEELPNGNEPLHLVFPNDISTNRDLLSWVASTIGGFATADRDGKLTIRSFADSEVVDRWRAVDRISGSTFSDYETQYAGISITDFESGYAENYYTTSGEGALINIGANPLLQSELDATRNRTRQAVADVVGGIAYTPFKAAILNCPVYDLGDLIECVGGVAGDGVITCCVMSIDWTFKQTTELQGYGADPSLSAGKTKADKAISSLSKKAKDDALSYYTFTNAEELTINSEEQTTLIDVEFAVNSPTTVMMFHELKMLNHLVDDTQTVTLYFYHGDDLIAYQPMDTYSEDETYHFFPSFYPLLDVMNGTTQRWRVKAQTSSGTATIAIDDVKATIVGQKMIASDEWLGTIKVEDEYTPIMAGALVGEYEDEATLETGTPVGYFRTTLDGSTRTTLDGNARTYIP